LATRAGATRIVWNATADHSAPEVYVHESHALEPVAPRADGAGGDLTGLRVWEVRIVHIT
jgi:hypothetical protein